MDYRTLRKGTYDHYNYRTALTDLGLVVYTFYWTACSIDQAQALQWWATFTWLGPKGTLHCCTIHNVADLLYNINRPNGNQLIATA